MERGEFQVGDRMLVQTYYASAGVSEIVVVEVGSKALKVRHVSGSTSWILFRGDYNDDVEHWTLIERLPTRNPSQDAKEAPPASSQPTAKSKEESEE